jgi:site-specific DNA-methyltransferase (adenine-specific)
MKPYFQDSHCTIYHGDCREILPILQPVDLLLTDPPYGIGYNATKSNLPNSKSFKDIANDENNFDFKFLFDFPAKDRVIFGAENFYKYLPHRGRWLVWDKRVNPICDAMLGSPFEMAWMDKKSGYYKIIRLQHGGVVNADKQIRKHPTQKPVNLLLQIIDFYPLSESILDPFMGSGSTLRAAKDLNRKAIGIELEEKYCEIAAKRLSQEVLPL